MICIFAQLQKIVVSHHNIDLPPVSQECTADVEDSAESVKSPSQPSTRARSTGKCAGAGKGNEALPSGLRPRIKQGWLSHTSLRRLQVSHSTTLTPAQDREKDEGVLTACAGP